VWFPDWSLGRPDAPQGESVLVVDQRVVAATSDLFEAGVRRGMPRREAEGLAPGSLVLVRDPGEEARRFEAVVLAIEEIVPRVEVAEPGLAFVPVKGAVSYYGDEDSLVETVAGKLDGTVRLGLADGPFAASWAARMAGPGGHLIVADTRGFLAGLDVSVLMGEGGGVESLIDTFRWLGVTTLGALADLPRQAIVSRFGDLGIGMHRLANGEDRKVHPRPIPPELAVEARFEEPLEIMDQVAFAARSLAARLMVGLHREGVSPHRVTVEVEAADGTVRSRVWRSSDPFTEQALADRVWWQLRAWVESDMAGGGVVRLRIDPTDISGDGRQLDLFDDATARMEAERALARAQALVGPDAVLQAAVQGGRMPSERVAWRRWGDEEGVLERDPSAPWPGATPSPAPALVPPEPRVIEVEWDGGIPTRVRLGSRWEPVLTWGGPWRLHGRWWRDEGASDRYQLVTSAGAFLCVYREGRTYLAGVYD